MKKALFILFGLCIVQPSFAGTICSFAPGITSGFDTILNTYADIATKWTVIILPKAQALFWMFFGFEFIYQMTIKKVLTGDIQKVASFFVIRVFTGYLCEEVFLDQGFYLGIITYFTNLGSTLSGQSIAMSGGAGGLTVSPSSIMNYMECQYGAEVLVFMGLSFVPFIGSLCSSIFFATLILIFAMPIALMMTMIDAYVVIYGGFILCGFAGSSWTQSYWQKYLSYVGGVAIRLFVTCLIMGLVIKSFETLNSTALPTAQEAIANPSKIITYIEAMFGLLFFNAVALVTIPNKAAGMLSGVINGGLGEVMGGAAMMMSGMRGVSSVTSAAKTFGGGVLNASTAGKTAAISKSRELLGGGASGGPNPSDWKSVAKTAGSDAAKKSVQDGWSNALNTLRNGPGGSTPGGGGQKGGIGQIGAAAQQAGNMHGSHSGASELNVNPHKE